MAEVQKARESSIMKRRGLLAGATALGAALVAKLGSPGRVEAANGQNMVLGQNNTATAPTTLTGPDSTTGFYVEATGGKTLWAVNLANGPAILSQGSGSFGLQADSISNAGAVCASTANAGLYAQGKYGCWGVGLGGTGIGVYGAVAPNQIPTGALAGLFDGPVVVNGSLSVAGDFAASGIKSAIVPNRKGQMVHLYAVEAPESYFEDYGTGVTGNDGAAIVDIPEDFREVARTNEYHIFLSAYGRNGGLYVYEQREIGFIVRDSDNTPGVRFSWRIVCRRADVDARRFEPASAESRGLRVERIPQPQPIRTSTNDRPR
jgi:hypothetical protein